MYKAVATSVSISAIVLGVSLNSCSSRTNEAQVPEAEQSFQIGSDIIGAKVQIDSIASNMANTSNSITEVVNIGALSMTPTNTINKKIPDSFVNELKDIAQQAMKKQPILKSNSVWLADTLQLVDLQAIDKVMNSELVLAVFAVEYTPGKSDWAARLKIDVKNWKVLSWEVNPNINGEYKAFRNQFPNTSSQQHYLRAVSINRSEITKDFAVADLGSSVEQTLIYDQEGKSYRIIQNGQNLQILLNK